MSDDAVDDLDDIYKVPLSEFVGARNALAAARKKSGDADEAMRIKALPKPSASAWAVNQLYWSERETFDAMIAAGDELRRALESGPGNQPDEREPGRVSADDATSPSTSPFGLRRVSPKGSEGGAKSDAVGEALRRTRALVEASGQNATESLMRRIATTLEALSSYGSANPSPMRGRLTEAVQPPGFGAFAGLTPAAPEPPAPTPERERAQRVAAVARARANLDDARSRIDRIATGASPPRAAAGAHRRTRACRCA